MTSWGRVVFAAALVFVLTPLGDEARAQTSGAFKAAQKLSDSGRHREAAAELSRVLNSGKLSPAETARGFYLRGVSLSKSGKNPQAISDLTNALWLTGLSNEERSNAYLMRAAAYKASGFKAKARADLNKAKAAPSRTQTAAPIPLPTTPVKQDVSGAGTWATQTADANPVKVTKTATAQAPAPTVSSGGGVSSFLGGIFGGASSPSSSSSALSRDDGPVEDTPARPGKPVAQPAIKKPTRVAAVQPNETAISSWSSSVSAAPTNSAVAKQPTKPKKAPPKQVASVNWNTAVAATPKVAPTKPVVKKTIKPATKQPVKKGRYNVQVATVRNREAAEQISQSVRKQAPKALAGLKPSIDKAVLGNMGTFFRVRVDGLPSRQASVQLCKTLLKQGHDCFLLTR